MSRQNKVHIFTDGNALFHKIIGDIEAAKKSIHIEFYTFYNDKIGNEILNLLIEKAREGVEVRVIYDSWGSMGTTRKFFQPLVDAGGKAFPFLNTRSVLLDFRINFRDHRKIIVIDGTIGYTGGFNIGDQYLGRKKKNSVTGATPISELSVLGYLVCRPDSFLIGTPPVPATK